MSELNVSKDALDLLLTFYKEFSEKIRHENTLIDHRTSWFITIQSFLVAAFSALYYSYIQFTISLLTRSWLSSLPLTIKEEKIINSWVRSFLIVFCSSGLMLSLVAFFLIGSAALSIFRTESSWNTLRPAIDKVVLNKDVDFDIYLILPELPTNVLARGFGIFLGVGIPIIFIGLWTGFLYIVVEGQLIAAIISRSR